MQFLVNTNGHEQENELNFGHSSTYNIEQFNIVQSKQVSNPNIIYISTPSNAGIQSVNRNIATPKPAPNPNVHYISDSNSMSSNPQPQMVYINSNEQTFINGEEQQQINHGVEQNEHSILDMNVQPLFDYDKRLESIDSKLENLSKAIALQSLAIEFLMKHMKIPMPEMDEHGNITLYETAQNNIPAQNAAVAVEHSPIDTVDELNAFEQILKEDIEKKNALKDLFIREMGTDVGMGKGRREVALILVDRIFTRRLFTVCSWTGQTSDPAFPNGKTAMQKYDETVKFFWEIVNNADKTYDTKTNRSFFQDVMSSSKQRLNKPESSKRIRSAGKCRPKNLKYKKKTAEETLQTVRLNSNNDGNKPGGGKESDDDSEDEEEPNGSGNGHNDS